MRYIFALWLFVASAYATDTVHHVFTGGVLVLLVVVLLFLSRSISLRQTASKDAPSKSQMATNYIDNQEIVVKTKHFDIRGNLLYFFKTLNYDATKNNNTFISDINLEATNIHGQLEQCYDLQGDPELIIGAMNTIIQLFNKQLRNTTMLIKLDMFAIDDDVAYFDFMLGIYTTNYELVDEILSSMQDKDGKLYHKLQSLKKSLTFIKGSEISIDRKLRSIGFKFVIPRCQNSPTDQLPRLGHISRPSALNIYIAHDDSLVVGTIKSSLEKSYMPFNSVLNLEKFIDFTHNAVFQTNIINAFFVSTEYLRKIAATHRHSLQAAKQEKRIKIFAVAHNSADVDYIKHNFEFVEIMMLPYTNDYFDVIVGQILGKY